MIGRIAAFLIGVVFLYIAVFFTKNDDGRVQNWLVELWVRVENISTNKRRRAVVLFNMIAAAISKLLTNIFGAKLLSPRFAATSVCLSLCSLFLLSTLRLGEHMFGRLWYASSFVIACLMTEKAIKSKSLKITSATACFLLAWLAWQCWFWYKNSLSALGNGSVFSGILIGIFLDISFVAIVRKITQQQKEQQSLTKIVAAMTLNLIMGCVLIAPSWLYIIDSTPFFGSYDAHSVRFSLEWTVVIASTTNILAVLCAFSMVAVSIAAVAHRFIWSIAARLIHVCYERRVIENRIFLFSLGSMLLSYSINWFSWLHHLPH
jgi:hypothetical protein